MRPKRIRLGYSVERWAGWKSTTSFNEAQACPPGIFYPWGDGAGWRRHASMRPKRIRLGYVQERIQVAEITMLQ